MFKPHMCAGRSVIPFRGERVGKSEEKKSQPLSPFHFFVQTTFSPLFNQAHVQRHRGMGVRCLQHVRYHQVTCLLSARGRETRDMGDSLTYYCLFLNKAHAQCAKSNFFPLLSNSLKRTPNHRLVAIVSVSFVLQNIFSEPAIHH